MLLLASCTPPSDVEAKEAADFAPGAFPRFGICAEILPESVFAELESLDPEGGAGVPAGLGGEIEVRRLSVAERTGRGRFGRPPDEPRPEGEEPEPEPDVLLLQGFCEDSDLAPTFVLTEPVEPTLAVAEQLADLEAVVAMNDCGIDVEIGPVRPGRYDWCPECEILTPPSGLNQAWLVVSADRESMELHFEREGDLYTAHFSLTGNLASPMSASEVAALASPCPVVELPAPEPDGCGGAPGPAPLAFSAALLLAAACARRRVGGIRARGASSRSGRPG